MTKIGLLSDTHGYIDDNLFDFFKDVDEIWHAGDIGSIIVLDQLIKFKKLRAVYGNIDDQILRKELPENLKFNCERLSVWMTHIGGYPGKYDWSVKNEIMKNPPDLFISGHSHILKVMNDKKLNLLHMNPGAYGKSGLHQVRTALKFCVETKNISKLEILELPR